MVDDNQARKGMRVGKKKRSARLPSLGSVMKEVASYLKTTNKKRLIVPKPNDAKENDIYVVDEDKGTPSGR